MATIEHLMSRDVVSVPPTATATEAAKRMRAASLGAVLVVDGDRLTGIFTERDLLDRIVAEGRDPRTTPVEEAQTHDPLTVPVGTHVRKCAALIREHGFRHLPVVDDVGRPVGVVSTREFLQFVVEALEQFVDRAIYEKKLEQGVDPYAGIGGGYER